MYPVSSSHCTCLLQPNASSLLSGVTGHCPAHPLHLPAGLGPATSPRRPRSRWKETGLKKRKEKKWSLGTTAWGLGMLAAPGRFQLLGPLSGHSWELPEFTPLTMEAGTALTPHFSGVHSLSHVQLCDAMDCSMPGFPVLHCLPEFAQINVH